MRSQDTSHKCKSFQGATQPAWSQTRPLSIPVRTACIFSSEYPIALHAIRLTKEQFCPWAEIVKSLVIHRQRGERTHRAPQQRLSSPRPRTTQISPPEVFCQRKQQHT